MRAYCNFRIDLFLNKYCFSFFNICIGVKYQDRIEQLENNSEDRKTAEEVEKDHPLKIITEHKDQKKRPDEEKDRLLKMSKVFETKLDLGKKT